MVHAAGRAPRRGGPSPGKRPALAPPACRWRFGGNQVSAARGRSAGTGAAAALQGGGPLRNAGRRGRARRLAVRPAERGGPLPRHTGRASAARAGAHVAAAAAGRTSAGALTEEHGAGERSVGRPGLHSPQRRPPAGSFLARPDQASAPALPALPLPRRFTSAAPSRDGWRPCRCPPLRGSPARSAS